MNPKKMKQLFKTIFNRLVKLQTNCILLVIPVIDIFILKKPEGILKMVS